MRSGRVYSIAIAALLVASVGLKVRLRGLNETDGPDVKAYVSSLAVWHGFWLDNIEQADSQMDRIAIRAGDCGVVLVFASPLGWHRDSIRRAAAPGDKVFFLYRGRRYDDQPVWETVTDHYRRRFSRVLGDNSPPHPLLGVIASSGCPPEGLDWLQQDPTIRT